MRIFEILLEAPESAAVIKHGYEKEDRHEQEWSAYKDRENIHKSKKIQEQRKNE
ncbi:hypothetical protein [Bacillus sp. FJAT-27225]|uniref:hypothetical protein n=1 Tax=Bacillus sp. FJAT-27225 TaxID=1743144 RepID=UPI0015866697|nr:hypothetical protein [Bacillus sp. FJAT-27225]